MVQFQSIIAKMHPGIFIHSVYIDEDEKEDKRATFVRSLHTYHRRPHPAGTTFTQLTLNLSKTVRKRR